MPPARKLTQTVSVPQGVRDFASLPESVTEHFGFDGLNVFIGASHQLVAPIHAMNHRGLLTLDRLPADPEKRKRMVDDLVAYGYTQTADGGFAFGDCRLYLQPEQARAAIEEEAMLRAIQQGEWETAAEAAIAASSSHGLAPQLAETSYGRRNASEHVYNTGGGN